MGIKTEDVSLLAPITVKEARVEKRVKRLCYLQMFHIKIMNSVLIFCLHVVRRAKIYVISNYSNQSHCNFRNGLKICYILQQAEYFFIQMVRGVFKEPGNTFSHRLVFVFQNIFCSKS